MSIVTNEEIQVFINRKVDEHSNENLFQLKMRDSQQHRALGIPDVSEW